MPKLYVVHWNADEAATLVAPLMQAKYEVIVHSDIQTTTKWGDVAPDAVVISLQRLPSHGRAIAEWVWAAKKRQTIPIIFVGGDADKVVVTRAQFPKASYCESNEVADVLRDIFQRATS